MVSKRSLVPMLNCLIFKPFSCFCILFLFILQGIYAQEKKINFTSLTSKDGLSSNVVTAILKDRFGIMWFATEDGLNKYDGTSFTVYRHIAGDSSSLPTNEVVALHEDRSGTLWIGTNGGSICSYDRKKDKFRTLSSHKGFNSKNNVIRAIASDYANNLWISNVNGLSVLNPSTGKLSNFLTGPVNSGRLASKTVLCIFEDSKRRIWVGSADGLFLYNRAKNSFSQFINVPGDEGSLPSNAVRSVEEDANGVIWVGTDRGLGMLLPDGRRFKRFRYGEGQGAISSSEIYSVVADRNGGLWLGTEDGISVLDIHSGKVDVYKPDSRNIYSLASKSVRYIYIDDLGTHWVSTYKGGINKSDVNLNLFNLKRSNPFDDRGLSSSNVTSFAEAANGDIFIGTDGGGLNLFDRRTGLFRHFDLKPTNAASAKLAILSLEMSKDGKLWIGTYVNGLFALDVRTGKYEQYAKNGVVKGLINNSVFCLKEDSRGNIWIGTNGDGISVYNPETKVFRSIYKNTSAAGTPRLPTNGYIRAIEEDSRGDIWIGSHGSGLAVFKPQNESFKLYDKTNSRLPNNVVLSVVMDRNKKIWVGTRGGLSLFNEKTGQFTTYSEKDGLSNAAVYEIIEDGRGLLWLSTTSGISSFDPKTKKFHNYNTHNGVQNSNFNSGAGLRTLDGELFFGGQDGFNHFNPANLKTNVEVPSVLVTELKVDNKVAVPGEDSPIDEHITVSRDIYLDYAKNFSLDFVALSYVTSQQYRYAYMLEGFDKSWNHVGQSRTASYTNLDPGDYIFKVRACDADGTKCGEVTSIRIHVKPPFWMTIYAYILYVATALGILLYVRYRGIRNLKRKFEAEQERSKAKQLLEQERKEAERLHELDMLKIKFLTNLSHEFRTPISLIMGPVDTLLSEEKFESGSSHLFMIKRNARRLLNLVNQLLDFRKMEERELKLSLSEGEFVSFVKDVSELFRDLSSRKNIDLVFESQLHYFNTSFDHDKLERILFNVLSNAFKFTPAGGIIKVEVEIRHSEDAAVGSGIVVKISDTGIGIAPDKKDKVFNRFFQGDSNTSTLNQGSGIGLSITKEFVKMHGGSISVVSEQGKGSSFIINFPFVSENFAEKAIDSVTAPIAAEQQFNDNIKEPETPVVEDVPEKEDLSKTDVPTVLLVEDNDDFRFYLKDNLKSFYRVYEASNGKEGWQKALAHHPQIIVSDISMPFMDGIELCNKVKADKRTSHIPIILLTALTGEEEQIRGLQTGANDYMTKPFNFEILNAKIKNLLVLNRTLKDTYTKQIKVQAPELVIESQGNILLNKIMLYLEENLNNPKLSVEDLSRHVGMSRVSLYHKILELTGQSPVEYIRSIKLERAAVLLEKSDLNIAQISYMVGFATPNYFAKSFKARFNMQPSEYMAAKRKGAEGKVRMEK
ncbi:signal transduction histidine kinase [Arcticibacter pallidicorallinus]|uniref:histidine kinase n=2 Tax=Arcticibacter pallidicorallinus TaxID=1259464 RepID=A0A2T0UB34_9SPHI|nr:signal transduction histidine kinase [Arcticibacter pallidicorallinus]